MPASERPHVFLIGAARSGTKILRDTLGELPGVAPVPYDMNFVWRIGNDAIDHDELAPGSISERHRRRIRRLIERTAAGDGVVLEKTVSNALRVDFVRWLYPEARYIHLLRDGVDVAESVMRQWQAPTDWRYLARKLRTVPATASPRYAVQHLRGLVGRGFGRGHDVTWGPRYAGIDADLGAHPLAVVCARQWRRCVERANDGLSAVPVDLVSTVRYEDLVADPDPVLRELALFLELDTTPETLRTLGAGLRTTSVGRGRRSLGPDDLALIERELDRDPA